MSDEVKGDMALLMKKMEEMVVRTDASIGGLSSRFDKRFDDMQTMVKQEIKETFEPMKAKQDEIMGLLARLQSRVDTLEAGAVADDGDALMSDSSGVATQQSKRPRAAGGSSSGSAPLPRRAPRASSADGGARPPRPPADPPRSENDWALAVTGFKRKVPRALLEKSSQEVISLLPPDTRQVATFWSHPYATFFKVKFSTKAAFLTALDYMKENPFSLTFDDKIDEVVRPLYVRRDRPIDQLKMGRFNSHFYSAVEAMLKGSPHEQRRLRFYNGDLMIDFEGDVMLLISYVEVKGSASLEATPHHGHFQRIGLGQEVVDTMMATAMAAAKASARV